MESWYNQRFLGFNCTVREGYGKAKNTNQSAISPGVFSGVSGTASVEPRLGLLPASLPSFPCVTLFFLEGRPTVGSFDFSSFITDTLICVFGFTITFPDKTS